MEVLALVLSDPAPPSVVAGAAAPDGKILSRGTLVVCAVSLVGQWADEVGAGPGLAWPVGGARCWDGDGWGRGGWGVRWVPGWRRVGGGWRQGLDKYAVWAWVRKASAAGSC